MTTAALLTLIAALHGVETTYSTDPRMGDKGPLQIEAVCVRDVNRIIRLNKGAGIYTLTDRADLVKSREMAAIYMTHWVSKVSADERRAYGDLKVMARIYHRGPRNWRDRFGAAYWLKVKKNLGVSR